MAGAFTSLTDSFKELYPQSVVESMVNDEAPFRAFLKRKTPAAFSVKEGLVTFLAETGAQQALGQMADGIGLPPAMDRTDVRLQLIPTNFAAAIEIGFLTSSAGNSNKSAFNGGEIQRNTNGAISHLGKFIESTYTGTHGTGRRARVESDGSNNFVAALPEGVKLLRKGYYLSGRSTDAGSVSGSFDAQRITAITRSTRTVTYGGTDRTLTAGDHIHVVTVASQTLTSTFANGLRGLIDDGTYLGTVHGKSRTTYPELNAQVFSNGGVSRNLTESLLVRAIQDTEEFSGKKITDIWAGPGQFDKYMEFTAPDRRIMATPDNPGDRAMGSKFKFRVYVGATDAEFHRSFDIVPGELYGLNMDTFFHYVARELGPLDIAGVNMFNLSPGSGTYNASLLGYVLAQENIGCERFDANFVMRDLKDYQKGDA